MIVATACVGVDEYLREGEELAMCRRSWTTFLPSSLSFPSLHFAMMAPVCWHAAAVFLSVVLSLFIVEVASLPAGSPDSSWSAGSNFVPMDEDDSITSAHSRNGPSWHHAPSGQHEGLPQPWHHDPSDLHQPALGVSGSAPILPHQHDPAWVPAPIGPLDDLDHMILDHLLNDVSAAAPPSGQGIQRAFSITWLRLSQATSSNSLVTGSFHRGCGSGCQLQILRLNLVRIHPDKLRAPEAHAHRSGRMPED